MRRLHGIDGWSAGTILRYSCWSAMGKRITAIDAQPDGGPACQSQRACRPETIPTGFLRNDGRVDNNTASSECTSKALGHDEWGSENRVAEPQLVCK
jgi:hypothetical protein